MRAMVEEVSGTLGAITLLLDAWYMKRYLIVDVLTRDAIVIGQVRRDTALYEPPPPGKPGRPRKYGDRITREKLRTLTQTHTELPIYGIRFARFSFRAASSPTRDRSWALCL